MAPPEQPNPKVFFISYSHDSPEHAYRVLALTERFRKDGLDAQLDQYVAGTLPEGWPIGCSTDLMRPISSCLLHRNLQPPFPGPRGAGSRHLIGLGLIALLFALFLPGGLWRLANKRLHLTLLPIGYRLLQHSRPANSSHVAEQTAQLN